MRRNMIGDHWSCCSPPGVPNDIQALPSRNAMLGDSVVRGRLRGPTLLGWPALVQNIWPRVDSGKPSSGITGEDCSQPPDGVALTMVPQRSITSTWQVSPALAP